MIIETSDNRFYRVVETGSADLAHVWYGVEVRKIKGEWKFTVAGRRAYMNKRPELVRKAATRVVED